MVDLPPDRKAIASKWVFCIKRDHNGKIVKHKARLVAKGFSQILGIDFVETHSWGAANLKPSKTFSMGFTALCKNVGGPRFGRF
jgi:hypothetical protein